MFLTLTTKSFFKRIFSSILMILVFLPITIQASSSPANGQLKIVGSQLCNQSGQPVQLKGMSSHGLQWYGQFMNYDSIKFLRDNWGASVVRAAMYTNENGYIANPAAQKAKVKEIIQAAIDLNMYVIVDWHILSDGNPNTYKEQAKAFFQEIASQYGKYPNVIYEICNEPNGNITWAKDIKPYAQYIIPAIRSVDPDNIIIVGTGTWSQDVHNAADDPLAYSNIMYTCHFYSGTHTQWLRDRINYALSKGIAIFVTEWGTSDASGNGGPYLAESQKWIDYLAEKKISWTNWSLCDKEEASAALKSGANPKGGWTDSNLSASGQFVKKSMYSGNQNHVSNPSFSLPEGSYPSQQAVKLSCATAGAKIYYTTDDTSPTTSSTAYSAPITVSKTTTIKAFAAKSGMNNSPIVSAAYIINPSQQSSVAVRYEISNDWKNGATINITIKNNGTVPINGWTLVWALPSGQKITNLWSGEYTVNSSVITIKNLPYNKTIAPNGGTQTFGFNIEYHGQNIKPASFTLNGMPCKVQ